MPTPKGSFLWHQLNTADAPAALAFYKHVVGWTSEAMPMGQGGTYHRLEAQGRGAAGLVEVPKTQGTAPGWIGYIHSPDVDADAVRLRAAKGTVREPPADIPTVGRFAPISDPQGAGFILFKPQPPSGEAPEQATGVGAVGWAELHTSDWKAAFAFYSELFGWQKGDTMDMGPMGTYQIFTVGGEAVGGMMNLEEGQKGAPHWLYYFNVESIGAAQGRVKAKGGEVLHGPSEVPGGMWMIQCRDAEGVLFALLSTAR